MIFLTIPLAGIASFTYSMVIMAVVFIIYFLISMKKTIAELKEFDAETKPFLDASNDLFKDMKKRFGKE